MFSLAQQWKLIKNDTNVQTLKNKDGVILKTKERDEKLTLPGREPSKIKFKDRDGMKQVLNIMDDNLHIKWNNNVGSTATRWTKGREDVNGWFTLSRDQKYLTGARDTTSEEMYTLRGMSNFRKLTTYLLRSI